MHQSILYCIFEVIYINIHTHTNTPAHLYAHILAAVAYRRIRIGLLKATNTDRSNLDKYPDSLRCVISCQTISENISQINIRLD